LIDLRSSLLVHYSQRLGGHPRRVDHSTAFLIDQDRTLASETRCSADLDQIEACVGSVGPLLVSLYFRTAHHVYPILDEGVFREKYARSYREFSPPLLAAVYLAAWEWRSFDHALSDTAHSANVERLKTLAMQSMNEDMKRPKLSTLQAGLLLLQQEGAHQDFLPAQLVVVAQTLGVHADCESWDIPDWERGLRRRLAWAIFVQDKWGVIVHGRPSMIATHSDWTVRTCTLNDLPGDADLIGDDLDPVIDVESGRACFLHFIQLTVIFSDIISAFYSTAATKSSVASNAARAQDCVVRSSQLAHELQLWYSALPNIVQLEPLDRQKLSVAGSLHLAHSTAQLMLHRALVRALSADTPPAVRADIRTDAQARLESAVSLLESLQLVHIQSLWGYTTSAQMAMIGSFAGLLWATSINGEESAHCVRQLERFRRALQMRAGSARVFREALSLFDLEIGNLETMKSTSAEAWL
jgi:hypothetical protein